MGTEREKATWTGKSGQSYTFHIWPWPASLNSNQDGNYIFCKVEGDKWKPIYIGQGDLKDRSENHHQQKCLKQKGAKHFHCHLKGNEQDRKNEEGDLLNNYTEAYAPTGCNEKVGG